MARYSAVQRDDETEVETEVEAEMEAEDATEAEAEVATVPASYAADLDARVRTIENPDGATIIDRCPTAFRTVFVPFSTPLGNVHAMMVVPDIKDFDDLVELNYKLASSLVGSYGQSKVGKENPPTTMLEATQILRERGTNPRKKTIIGRAALEMAVADFTAKNPKPNGWSEEDLTTQYNKLLVNENPVNVEIINRSYLDNVGSILAKFSVFTPKRGSKKTSAATVANAGPVPSMLAD